MAETRACERCGTTFEPKREHARFCSARCRVAWNREQAATDGQAVLASPLDWAIIAMRETTGRLSKVRASDRPQAFAVIGEAVWWVTIVDATLVRYYPDAYENALAGLPGVRRRLTEGTFAGLRFVRNRMGYYADQADFIRPRRSDSGDGDAPITDWTWKSLPAPTVESLPPRGQEWEMSRYLAYQERLASHTIGETFSRASAFLVLASRAAEQCVGETTA